MTIFYLSFIISSVVTEVQNRLVKKYNLNDYNEVALEVKRSNII